MAEQRSEEHVDALHVPAGTSWPLLAALGATLAFASLVTHISVAAVGIVLFFVSAVGWFRSVLPEEEVELVALRPAALRARPVVQAPHKVEHLEAGGIHQHRMRIPAEIHSYSAGLLGGAAGGIAMGIVACAFGLIVFGSIWYPINLLAAAALPSLATASVEQLTKFDGFALFIATLIHTAMSLLTGFLYAFLLPTMPRQPIFTGGIVAPLLWTGLIWATLGVVNPVLDARIHWGWFIASQVVFGLVTGIVVARTERIRTLQTLPLALRAGIEGGIRQDDEERR